MSDLISGIITTTTGGTDHTSIMVPDMGDDTAGCSHTPIQTVKEIVVLEGTLHNLLPVTTATYATLQPMSAPVTPHTIAAPHPTIATSPTGTTPTTPQTRTGLTPATATTQGY